MPCGTGLEPGLFAAPTNARGRSGVPEILRALIQLLNRCSIAQALSKLTPFVEHVVHGDEFSRAATCAPATPVGHSGTPCPTRPLQMATSHPELGNWLLKPFLFRNDGKQGSTLVLRLTRPQQNTFILHTE